MRTIGACSVWTEKSAALIESAVGRDTESIGAGVKINTTCVELLAAIPKRVGIAAVLVAFTTIGAFSAWAEKATALVESAVGSDAESIVAGVEAYVTCVELLATIPKRVGIAAVLVALTTIGAFGNETALVESAASRDVESIVAVVKAYTTCVELLAAIPKRVVISAVIVALTTMGAFSVWTEVSTALVVSAEGRDAESIEAGVKAYTTCVE